MGDKKSGSDGRRGLSAFFGLGGSSGPSDGADSGGETSRLRRILEINRALATERDPARLYARILDVAVELTGAERAFLVLLPKDTEPVIAAARSIDKEDVRAAGSKVSRTVLRRIAESGQSQRIESALEDPALGPAASVTEMRLVSILALPLAVHGEVAGCLYLDNRFERGKFSDDHRSLMELFADQAAVAVENARLHAENVAAREQLAQLNQQLSRRVESQETQLRSMRDALDLKSDAAPPKRAYAELIGRAPALVEMKRLLDVVVETEFPVLILGESGTGKELVARAIHRFGSRQDKPFVAENCAAIAVNLLEAELFGHVRGAFTGADRDKDGLFAEADGGTLFLDEIGDMDPALQKKLLRVLQEGEFRKVGGTEPQKVDVRIVAATNADLAARLADGSFREDLYYRLKVMSVRVPPLRERRGDIPELVHHFLGSAAREMSRPAPEIDDAALAALMAYSWPGNVRELRNEVYKLVALAAGRIERKHLISLGEGTKQSHLPLAGRTLAELEKEAFRQALEASRGKRIEAARMLGLPRRTFYNRLKRYGLL